GLLANDPASRPDSASTLRRDLTQAMMKAPTVAKLKVATAIEAPQAEPTQQLDIEDLEQPQGTIGDTLAEPAQQPATAPAVAQAEASVILSESQRPPAPEPARPAPVAQQKPAEEKSKAPLFIGIALVVLILIALVSMLGGDDDASGRALPAEA